MVNRISDRFDSAGNGFAVAVRKKGCDFAIVKERDRGRVQTGLAFSVVAVVPRAEFEATPVMTGAEDENVALTEAHTFSLLTFFQLGGHDRLARFQPIDAAKARYIEEHSTANDAVRISSDVLKFGPRAVKSDALLPL